MALRFLRLTPTLPHSEKPRIRHPRRAGETLAVSTVVERAHHADTTQIDVDLGRYQDRLSTHDRVGVDLDLGRGEVGVAKVDHAAAPQSEGRHPLRHIPSAAALEAAQDGQKQRRRRGSARATRGPWSWRRAGRRTGDPARRRSCAAYALVSRIFVFVHAGVPQRRRRYSSCAACMRSVSAAGSDLFRDAGVLISVEPTTNAGTCKGVGQTVSIIRRTVMETIVRQVARRSRWSRSDWQAPGWLRTGSLRRCRPARGERAPGDGCRAMRDTIAPSSAWS